MGFFLKDKKETTVKAAYQPQDTPNLYHESTFVHTAHNVIRLDGEQSKLIKHYENNAVIYSLIDWKARRMCEIMPNLYKVKDKAAAKVYKSELGKHTDGNKLISLKNLKSKAFEEIDLQYVSDADSTYGMIKRILKRPSDMFTWSQFVYHFSATMDTSGNQPIWKNILDSGPNAGKIHSLYPLAAHLTEIIGGMDHNPIKEYRTLLGDYSKTYKGEDVILIRSHSFNYDQQGRHLQGTSKVKAALGEIDIYEWATQRELYSYQTGDSQTAVFPKDTEGKQSLEQMGDTGRIQWMDGLRKMLGQKTRNNISMVPFGLDAIKLGTALKDTNTTESKEKAVNRMCGVWHISPILLGSIQTGTDSKTRDSAVMALRDAVFPEARMLNEALQEHLIDPHLPDHVLMFDYDVFPEMQQNISEAAEALSKMPFLSTNEARAFVNYDDLDIPKAKIPQIFWEEEFNPISIDGEI
jgi:hypothetical protein